MSDLKRGQKVELRPAYAWDCEECGRENFENGVIPELSPEDIEFLREEHGVEAWEAGEFICMPDEVVCRYCQAKFTTIHPHNTGGGFSPD